MVVTSNVYQLRLSTHVMKYAWVNLNVDGGVMHQVLLGVELAVKSWTVLKKERAY